MERNKTRKWQRADAHVQALVRHFQVAHDGNFDHPDADLLPYHSFSSAPEDQPPTIRDRAIGLVFSLDRKRFDEAIGQTLPDSAIAELAAATATYTSRFHVPTDEALTERDWDRFVRQPDHVEMEVRRAFVREVMQILENSGVVHWHGYYDLYDAHDGPVVRVLPMLLAAAGEARWPSDATIYHDVHFVRTGIERHH